MDNADAPDTPDRLDLGHPDATAAYRVTAPPTGGPGGWPTATPMGEAREVIEQVVCETREPPVRQTLKVLLTAVVILIITVGTIVMQDLDNRLDASEDEVEQLEQRVADLEADRSPSAG